MMQLRGNFVLFHWIELIAGILIVVFCRRFGDWGLAAGGVPFFLGLALTTTTRVDEREMYLAYRSQAWESIITAAVLALIYFMPLTWNWFHAFIATAMISRGVIGIYSHLRD
jgi:hypothetical protein